MEFPPTVALISLPTKDADISSEQTIVPLNKLGTFGTANTIKTDRQTAKSKNIIFFIVLIPPSKFRKTCTLKRLRIQLKK